MSPKEITVVTGTRAEYGLLRSSMEAIRENPSLSLSVVATGMHLSPQYGRTVEAIREDGYEVTAEVEMLLDTDSERGMAKSLGIGTSGLADALANIDPEFTLVLGDRDEALAATLASAHLNVPVGHIHGGDTAHGAMLDNSIRHAITKFAHLHFPVSEESAERIERLGEEPWRITTVGAPGLDAVLDGEYTPPSDVRSRYGLPGDRPLVVVVQHPLTTDPGSAGEQMRATLEAAASFDAEIVVIYPNSDTGGKRIIEEIKRYSGRVHAFKNLVRSEYLGLLAAADALVGNSSSGIVEAPSFDLPVVDVGPRQEGRQRSENTLSVPHDGGEIRAAIDRCLHDGAFRQRVAEASNPYARGGSGRRIAERLAEVPFDDRLLEKRMTY